MLKKIIGIIVIIILVYEGVKILREQMSYSSHVAEIVMTQTEVNNISQAIYIELILRNNNLLNSTPDELCNFIKNSMFSRNLSRNTCNDHWGTPFSIRAFSLGADEVTNPDSIDKPIKILRGRKSYGCEGYEVRSAGPDKIFYTEDDIENFVKL